MLKIILSCLSEPEIFKNFFLLYLLYMRDCKQTLPDDAMSEVIWDTGQLDCPRLFQRKCWKLDLVFILKSAVSPLTGLTIAETFIILFMIQSSGGGIQLLPR